MKDFLISYVSGTWVYFFLPTLISALLVPVVQWIGLKLEIYAVENERTVHHGKIVRIGGVAIFLAFMISIAVLFNADKTINSILIGASMISLMGLVDDIMNLPSKLKFLIQGVAALVVIVYGGIGLDVIYLPLGITIDVGGLSFLVTFLWIVGTTNAINFIDGLDGLLSGIAIIVLTTTSIIAFQLNRSDVVGLALVLAGSCLGFWFYNHYPAKLFMGDCGSQFIGFIISCISLLGFKTSTVISLGFPIIALFIPLADTIVAMARRKLSGMKMDQADKGHIHHVLMIKLNLGHKNAVNVLHLVVLMFSICAMITFYNRRLGLILVLLLLIVYELFVEYTGMLNPKFHPILGVVKKLCNGKPLLLNEKQDDK